MESIKNRNESFYTQIEKFGARRKAVYNLLQTYGLLTTHQIKNKMRLGKHQVSGRITELKQSFFIKSVGSVYNEETKVKNTVWCTTTLEERVILIASKALKLKKEYDILQCDENNIYISKMARKLIKNRIKKINKLINTLK